MRSDTVVKISKKIPPNILVLNVIIMILASIPGAALAETRQYDLNIHSKRVQFTERIHHAIAVNDSIPAPTLYFNEGDHAILNVCNYLDKPTSLHWHGIIVPWQMDGVEGVSQEGILPGNCFSYQFQLLQSGTYWYHAHTGLQEQDGLYGAIVIHPKNKSPHIYNTDFVIVLSDWGNEGGEKIHRNLKKTGDYYSDRFPLQVSLLKFIQDYRGAKTCEERKQILQEYHEMQRMRMDLYDLSDVAYDAYLLNGHTSECPWSESVKVNDWVRLRFIGAAGSTIYRVKIPGAKLKIINVQGNDVIPYIVNDFSIAPGETYDVLVKVEEDRAYYIYGESIDTYGKVLGVLVTHPAQTELTPSIDPFPTPEPVFRTMRANMMSHQAQISREDHSAHTLSNHSAHPLTTMMHSSAQKDDVICPGKEDSYSSASSKYQPLKAKHPTNDPNKPVASTIHMSLSGYMDRFIWFINGVPEYKAKPITIEAGKRYRIIFTNHSMMRHPMHIHGHWFIARFGKQEFDPLLHTIDVAPGETIVAEVDAEASGQWFFHCHHIFHMASGMSRVFQYSTLPEVCSGCLPPENFISKGKFVNRPWVRQDNLLPLDPALIEHPIGHRSGFYFASWVDFGQDVRRNEQTLSFYGLYGSDDHKLQLFCNDADFNHMSAQDLDLDIFYWHPISEFWAIKGGANMVYRPKGPYWQPGIGFEALMPYYLFTNFRMYQRQGSTKFDLDLTRDTELTDNISMVLEARAVYATRTLHKKLIGRGFNVFIWSLKPYYEIAPGASVFIEYEQDNYMGTTRRLRRLDGLPSVDRSLTIGLSLLF